MTKALWSITRGNLRALIPLFVFCLFFAALMTSYAALAFGKGNEAYTISLLGFAMAYPSPIFIAAFIRLIQHSIDARFDAFRSFMEIGGRRSRVTLWLLAEIVAIIVISMCIGLAVEPIMRVAVIKPMFAGSGAHIGTGYSIARTFLVSLAFLLLLGSISLLFAKRRLAATVLLSGKLKPMNVWIVFVLGSVGLAFSIFLTLGPSFNWYQPPTTLVGFFALPWCIAAPLLLFVLVWAIGKLSLRVFGWNSISLAARNIRARFPTGIAIALTLLMGYPSCVYMSQSAMVEGARIELATHIKDASLLVSSKGALLSMDAATSYCSQLGASCTGMLEWGVSNQSVPGSVNPEPRDMRVMYPTTATAFDDVFVDQFESYNSSSKFVWNWLKPWAEVADHEPGRVTGVAMVISDMDAAPAGTKVISSQALTHLLPEELFYPYADNLGNRELPLLFFFFTVSGLGAIFAVTVVRQWPLLQLEESLRTIGTPHRMRYLTRIAVAIAPALVAIGITFVIMLTISSVIISSYSPGGKFSFIMAPMDSSALVLIVLGLLSVLVPALLSKAIDGRQAG